MANLDVIVDDLGSENEEDGQSNPDLLALLAEEDNLIGQFGDLLDDERVAEIGAICARGFEEDWKSEAEWRTDIEKIHKIVEQEETTKTTPWPGAANVNFPMITNACLQFNARAYSTLLNNGQIALSKVVGDDDGVPAQDQQGQPLQNPETGEPQWQIEPGAKKERADRVSHHMSYQLTEEMEEWEEDTDRMLLAVPIDGCAFKKVYFDPDLGRNVSEFITASDLVVNDATKNIESCPRISHMMAFYPNEIQEKVGMGLWTDPELELPEGYFEPEEFVEQHTYLDLDEDGYSEPYVVTYHKDSSKVVRIVANYDVEGIEVNGDEVAKVRAKRYFVKYECFPNFAGGFKGTGFGQLLLHINLSINSLINQLLDAGTLANTGGGFFAKSLRIKSGSIRFAPAEWHKVDNMGMSIKDAIVPLPVNEPSQTLFTLLGLMIDSGKELASIQDVMTGGGPQSAAVGTTLALIEQGMKVYTSIFKRLYRSLKTELRLLYDLNSKFLEDQTYSKVMDDPRAISQQDYEQESMDIMPAADPNMATDIQKAAKAQALQSFIGRPWINSMAIDRETMEAMNIADPDRFLVEPSNDPTPEELLAMIKAQNETRDSKSKAWKTLADALESLQSVEEKGGDPITNMGELSVIKDIAKKTGIIDEETNPEGPEPGRL